MLAHPDPSRQKSKIANRIRQAFSPSPRIAKNDIQNVSPQTPRKTLNIWNRKGKEIKKEDNAPLQSFLEKKISLVKQEALRVHNENLTPTRMRVEALKNLIHQFVPYLDYVRRDDFEKYERFEVLYDALIYSIKDMSQRVDTDTSELYKNYGDTKVLFESFKKFVRTDGDYLSDPEKYLEDRYQKFSNINQNLEEKLNYINQQIDNLMNEIRDFERDLCEAPIINLILRLPQLDRELSEVLDNINTIIESNMRTLEKLKINFQKISPHVDSLRKVYEELIFQMDDNLVNLHSIQEKLVLARQMLMYKKKDDVIQAIRKFRCSCVESKDALYKLLDKEKTLGDEMHKLSNQFLQKALDPPYNNEH